MGLGTSEAMTLLVAVGGELRMEGEDVPNVESADLGPTSSVLDPEIRAFVDIPSGSQDSRNKGISLTSGFILSHWCSGSDFLDVVSRGLSGDSLSLGFAGARRAGVVDLEAESVSLSVLESPKRESEGELEPLDLPLLLSNWEPIAAESGITTQSRGL